MKKMCTILLLAFYCCSNAQQMLSNSGFEDLAGTDNDSCQLWEGRYDSWNCANTDVPANIMGHQNGFNGCAYIGMQGYSVLGPTEYFIIGEIVDTLVPFTTYYMEAQISLADQANYYSNNWAVRFSTTPIPQNLFSTTIFPHIILDGPIPLDYSDWTTKFKTFTPLQPYKYFAFYSYSPDTTAGPAMCPGDYQLGSYVFVDAMCLIPQGGDCLIMFTEPVEKPKAKLVRSENFYADIWVDWYDDGSYIKVIREKK